MVCDFDEFKDPSGNYRIFIDDSFDADPQKKLNNTYTHGELVSLLIGGNKTGVSDKIGIYAIPAYLTEGGKIKFQASMYEKMYQAGVRIFSQSFGNPSYGITKENYPVASGIVDFYVIRLQQIHCLFLLLETLEILIQQQKHFCQNFILRLKKDGWQ